ncbi:MAG TPA: rhodanese-like domain-containing protein [Candidatus Acidoferrales bacterium]|nr:rhodanese-like domain-containing protein [Candidatus Acidoferrales bacterium]
MKPRFFASFLLGTLMLMPAALSSRAWPKHPQQAASAKAGPGSSASAKETLPFPQVPRITAEEVERLAKDKGNVVLVDTDDSESYAAEHIKGAVNVAYDPTADVRDQDQLLSALPGDKLIVFYCNCPHEEDSAPLVLEMWELGYGHDKVKALEGGLTRWEQLGYPLAGTDVGAGATQQKGN